MNVVYRIDHVAVSVECDAAGVHRYLADFFEVEPAVDERVSLRVRVDRPRGSGECERLVPSGPGPPVTEERDGVRIGSASSSVEAGIAAANLIRGAWARRLMSGPFCALHCSAYRAGDRLVLLVGDTGSGKTTLMLDAVLRHRLAFVANDVVVLRADAAGVVAVGTPALVKVRPATLARFDALRAQTWRTAEPHDGEHVSPRVLGVVPRPIVLTGTASRVTLAFPRFAAAGEPPTLAPLTPQAALDLCLANLRLEWVRSALARSSSQAPPVDAESFARDGAEIVGRLLPTADALTFRHDGRLAPALAEGRAAQTAGR